MAFAANGTGTGGPKQGLAVNGAWFPDGLDPKLERSFNDAHKAVRKDGGFSMSHRKMFASGLVSTGAAILLITGSVLSLRAFAESPYALIPVEYGVQLKAPDGHVVFEYVTKKPEKIGLTSPSAAYFHPVKTPSGETVTNVAPDDHPHHRGTFLGFFGIGVPHSRRVLQDSVGPSGKSI
jgi:hypothetical protein